MICSIFKSLKSLRFLQKLRFATLLNRKLSGVEHMFAHSRGALPVISRVISPISIGLIHPSYPFIFGHFCWGYIVTAFINGLGAHQEIPHCGFPGMRSYLENIGKQHFCKATGTSFNRFILKNYDLTWARNVVDVSYWKLSFGTCHILDGNIYFPEQINIIWKKVVWRHIVCQYVAIMLHELWDHPLPGNSSLDLMT